MLGIISESCQICVKVRPEGLEIRCRNSESDVECPKKTQKYIFGFNCLVETIEEVTSEPQEKGNQETEIPKTTARDLLKNKLIELADQGLPSSQAKILHELTLPPAGKNYELLREMAEEEGIELPPVKKGPREPTSDLRERISAGLKELQEQGDLPSQKEILRSMGLSGDLNQYKVLREVAEELSIKLPQDATGRKSPKEMHQEVQEVIQKLRKKGYWGLSSEEKKEKIVEVLGEEKLTAAQIAEKLNVFGGSLAKTLHSMFKRGMIEREAKTFRKNGKPEVYTYFQKGLVIDKPEEAQKTARDSNSEEDVELTTVTHPHLSYDEKVVLDALPERKRLKVKAIRRRIHKELSTAKVLVVLKGLLDKGYIQRDPRGGTEKNPIFYYSKISEKDIMHDFYLGHVNIENIAQKYDIPPLRITQIVTSEAGKLYASANLDEPNLQQQRKDDLKIERELFSDSEA